MEILSIIFSILFTLFWIFIMPVVIYAIVFHTAEFLVKHELMKKETYEKLDGDEPIFFFYIGWWIILGFFNAFTYAPF